MTGDVEGVMPELRFELRDKNELGPIKGSLLYG